MENRLRELRERESLTQEDLAARVGYHARPSFHWKEADTILH